MDFKEYLVAPSPEGLAAPWLAKGNGKTRNFMFGAALDSMVGRVKAAAKLRLPTLGPPDSLEPLGEERGIERGPSESSASYGDRLLGAWEAWPWAGTPFGMLSQFRAMGYDDVFVVQRNKRVFNLDADGQLVVTKFASNFNLGPDAEWARFVVLFAPPLPSAWSVSTPADSSDEANRIRRIISKWKPGHAKCAAIVILVSGHLWGFPSFLWGAGGVTWGPGDVRYLTPPA